MPAPEHPEPESGLAPARTELSEREQEILRQVATGLSNKEIAARLAISPNTVKVHLRNIFAKIEVASRTEATVYAIRHGLVQVPGRAGEAAAPAADGAQAETHAAPAAAPRPGLPRRFLPLAGGAALLGLLLGAIFGPRLFAPGAPQAAELSAPPRWQARAPMPTARGGLAVATYDNRIYAIAGDTGEGLTGVVERYDPEADSWESGLRAKPVPAADVSAAVIGGRVYLPGGRLEGGAPTDVVEVYDPRGDTWETAAPLPRALSGYALAAFEGKLYVFGGWDGAAYSDAVYAYDPDDDAWTERARMPTARAFAGAAAAAGRVYVVGGRDEGGALGANEAYSPEADAWQQSAPLPEARFGAGVASVADIVHVVGGEGGESVLLSVKYNLARDAWEAFEAPGDLGGPGLGLGVAGSDLHVIGGQREAVSSRNHAAFQAVYTVVLPIVQ